MNVQRSQFDERLFQNEQRTLSTTLMHSLVNITVQQHNAHRTSNLLPTSLALEISESDFSGVDSLIRDAHQYIDFHETKDGLSIQLSFEKIERLMKSIQREKRQNEILVEYLHKGASTSCLHDLFHLSKIQVVALRKKHNITLVTGGKQNHNDMFLAKIEYDKITTNHSNLKNDLLEVSEKLNIPLNTVWHAIRNPDYAEEVGGQKCLVAVN